MRFVSRGLSRQQVERFPDHPGNAHARHAAMIDGTFTQQTGTAFHFFAHHPRLRTDWAGSGIIGGSKNCNRGHAQS